MTSGLSVSLPSGGTTLSKCNSTGEIAEDTTRLSWRDDLARLGARRHLENTVAERGRRKIMLGYVKSRVRLAAPTTVTTTVLRRRADGVSDTDDALGILSDKMREQSVYLYLASRGNFAAACPKLPC